MECKKIKLVCTYFFGDICMVCIKHKSNCENISKREFQIFFAIVE